MELEPETSALRVETRLAVLGRGEHRAGEPINVGIVPASNFRAPVSGLGEREYARDDGTAGWDALEELLGDLEGGRAVCFSSGMGAIAAVLELLPTGARVVVPRDSYGGLRALLADGSEGGRWQVDTVDMTDPDALMPAVRAADLVWLETPSNPLLQVVDIAAVAARAHETGAVVAVDNTFATPLLQAPLALGADLVVHSATKFIGGHSDLLLGVVVARRDEDHARLVRRRVVAGATPGALECFLALRGARTLALRLRHAQDTAGELARRLQAHPAVARVRYPGLPDDPHHADAAKQMSGFGAVLSFELADGATADAVCAGVRVITHATSLGGVESTIERRAKLAGQEHVPAGLLRLSVGCEHLEDLWADLDAAIDGAAADTDSATTTSPDRAMVGVVTIELSVGDITAQPDLDAIVNAANAALMTGGGVAGAIHDAAGPGLAGEAMPLGPIRPGQCVRTDGHDLVNAHVLHCLGPVYGRDEPASALLADCYRHALRVAEEHGLVSVGFPAISTGAFGFPMGPAAEVALTTVVDLAPTLGSVTLIRFVLFDDDALLAHRNALAAALAE